MTPTRRNTGTGNLTDLGDGRWRMRHTHNAVTLRKNIRAATRRDAEKQLRRWIVDIEDGKVRPIDRDATVEAVLKEWIRRHPKKSAKDQQTCEIFIRLHIGPSIGHIPIGKLTPSRIQRFIDELGEKTSAKTGKPLKTSSVGKIHATLAAGLEWATRRNLIPFNPARNVEPPRPDKARTGEVETSTVLKLLGLAMEKNVRLGTFATLAAGTGARRGELVALRWGKVDWEDRTILVDVAASYLGREGGTVEKTPKNGKSRRVAVDPPVLAVLAAWRARVEAEAALRELKVGDNWLVFTNDPLGQRLMTPGQLSEEWMRLARANGQTVRLHDLRHHLASLSLNQGTPAPYVAEQLGHNVATLLSKYAHVVGEVDRRSAAAFGALLELEAPGREAPPS